MSVENGLLYPVTGTVKPRYRATAFNIIPQIQHISFGSEKHFTVSNNEILGIEHSIEQSLVMRYSEV